jgi:hypothetical protein
VGVVVVTRVTGAGDLDETVVAGRQGQKGHHFRSRLSRFAAAPEPKPPAIAPCNFLLSLT